ncbi:hypothetical protein D3C72_878940 [compost metagenome]
MPPLSVSSTYTTPRESTTTSEGEPRRAATPAGGSDVTMPLRGAAGAGVGAASRLKSLSSVTVWTPAPTGRLACVSVPTNSGSASSRVR